MSAQSTLYILPCLIIKNLLLFPQTVDPIDYSQLEQSSHVIPSPCNHNIPKAYSPEKPK